MSHILCDTDCERIQHCSCKADMCCHIYHTNSYNLVISQGLCQWNDHCNKSYSFLAHSEDSTEQTEEQHNHDCDDIAEDKFADMIVINMNRPNMRPINNIPKNIVYAGSKENVRLTMVAGKVLYEDGKFFIGEEPEAIYQRCENHMRELTK